MARELHSKATREALERSLRDQAVVNALVAGDLQSARWLWKSGGVLKGGVVPWDVEAFNGDPEALGWEPGRGYVVAMLPGLYEVSFGFFR